jgi:8-oxo-dGTP pyrophosphatase MutT (NUDIX family)
MKSPHSSPPPIRQACAVPFRRLGDRFEFCLITSLKKKRWIYPKGIVDPGETVQETALKEAYEEAGLHGRILGTPLGEYKDAKWGTELLVIVLLMEVTTWDEHWHEEDIRQRRWVPGEKALSVLSKRELRRFTKTALRQLSDATKI